MAYKRLINSIIKEINKTPKGPGRTELRNHRKSLAKVLSMLHFEKERIATILELSTGTISTYLKEEQYTNYSIENYLFTEEIYSNLTTDEQEFINYINSNFNELTTNLNLLSTFNDCIYERKKLFYNLFIVSPLVLYSNYIESVSYLINRITELKLKLFNIKKNTLKFVHISDFVSNFTVINILTKDISLPNLIEVQKNLHKKEIKTIFEELNYLRKNKILYFYTFLILGFLTLIFGIGLILLGLAFFQYYSYKKEILDIIKKNFCSSKSIPKPSFIVKN